MAEPDSAIRFGALPADRGDVLHRALVRARQAGAIAVSAREGSADRVISESDVIVSLSWPPTENTRTAVRAALAARKPVIVLETTLTAEWPALDPQTWQPRGFNIESPIVVSLDPRDEEHSLVLAIQRLSNDGALRERLASAAHEWSQRQPSRS